MSKIQVLTATRYFLPGYKAGGPIRTLSNLVDNLGHEIDFRILASDRDSGDSGPYQGVRTLAWIDCGQGRVFYFRLGLGGVMRLAYAFRRTSHDVLYLNSLFDAYFTVLPLLLRRLGLCQAKPVVVAPRGELSPGALGIRKRKKALFLAVAKMIGLYRGVIWQASSDYETTDIRSSMGRDVHIFVAPNLPTRLTACANDSAVARSMTAPLRLAFISRITPKKNLDFAVRVLCSVKVPVLFNIYGPEEDIEYTEECKRKVGDLPAHVQVLWHGAIHPDDVPSILSSQDLFFFPTRGENYGHVIAEAMSVGTPVLLADTTPWRDLEAAGVGWDLSLADEAAFVQCIERSAQCSVEEYAAWRKRVREYARSRLDLDAIVEANRQLFWIAASPAQITAERQG